MSTTIKFRRGTAAQWITASPVLAAGEPGLETDTGMYKIGDGVSIWSVLPYYIASDPTFPQTLENKSIDLADNAITGTKADFNAALTDGDFATLAGTETLTNKTLASPVITGPGQVQRVTKAVLEAIFSSTTLQNDDELLLPLAANCLYRLELFLLYAGQDQSGSLANPGGLKWDWGLPAGSLYNSTAGGLLTTGIANTDVAVLTTHVLTAGTAGNATFKWAQQTSSGTGTRVNDGCRLIATRLA